jgi:tRNA (cytidine/uridine-2'-O-)-methyltransferase
MRLVMYHPDIPQNLGTLLRFGACMGVSIEVIEPCGFPLDDRKIRRAGMDYIDHVRFIRHASWEEFLAENKAARKVLLTTKASVPYTEFAFAKDDILLVGSESAGVPEEVHQACEARVTIPMQPPMRSLNVAIAAAMVVGEGLRQVRLVKR